MRARPVAILAAIMVVLAGALVLVAWTGLTGRASLAKEVAQLRADLGQAQADTAAANARAAKAEAKVEALSAACCRPGVDPASVLVTVTPAAQTSRAASPTPAARRASPAASARPSPSSKPSPTPQPSPACVVYDPATGRCLI